MLLWKRLGLGWRLAGTGEGDLVKRCPMAGEV